MLRATRPWLIYLKKRNDFHQNGMQFPGRLVWDTNMAAVSFCWDTNIGRRDAMCHGFEMRVRNSTKPRLWAISFNGVVKFKENNLNTASWMSLGKKYHRFQLNTVFHASFISHERSRRPGMAQDWSLNGCKGFMWYFLFTSLCVTTFSVTHWRCVTGSFNCVT